MYHKFQKLKKKKKKKKKSMSLNQTINQSVANP